MYEVRIDETKNRMYITQSGSLTADEMQGLADAMISQMQKLRPGMRVINDISALKPCDEAGAPHIQRAAKAISDFGLGRVIRIIQNAPDELAVIGSLQFKRTARATAGYQADTAFSLSDAERMLDAQDEAGE